MAKKKAEKKKQELPGLPMERFKAAVDAVVKLRDSGMSLVFLTRRGFVKIVGSVDAFRQEYSAALQEKEIGEDEAREALWEVRFYLGLQSTYSSSSSVLGILQRTYYAQEYDELDTERKGQFEQLLEGKVKLVSEKLFTDAMKARARRLETATAPTVEDLDVELVQQRQDDYTDRTVKDPFVRLRLRYSRGDQGELPLLPAWIVMREPGALPTPSFEFECDESDIDLLIIRLTAAKKRLLDAQEGSGK